MMVAGGHNGFEFTTTTITGGEEYKHSTYSSTNKEPVASKRAKVVQGTFPEGKKKEAKGKGHHDRLDRRDPLYLAQKC